MVLTRLQNQNLQNIKHIIIQYKSPKKVCVCVCERRGAIQKTHVVFYPLHIVLFTPHLFLLECFSSSQILPVKNTGEKARGRNGGQQRLSEEKGPLRGPSSLLQNAPRDEDERSKKKKKVSLHSKDRFLFFNREAGCFSLREEGRSTVTQP